VYFCVLVGGFVYVFMCVFCGCLWACVCVSVLGVGECLFFSF